MKKSFLAFAIICLLLCVFTACQREITINLDTDDEQTEEPNQPVDPQDQPVNPQNAEQLVDALEFSNAKVIKSQTLPASSAPSEAPVISNFDKSISYTAGGQVILPVTVSANSAIVGVYVQIKGASRYFDVPVTGVVNGTASLPFNLSSLVGEGTFVLVLKYYDANKKISLSYEVTVTVTKPSSCGVTKVSGGQGLTSNIFKLSNTTGKIKISYNTFVVKDKIDVFQNGIWIGGTGPSTDRTTLRKALDCNVATEIKGYFGKQSAFLFDYDPAGGSAIEVVVSGCEDGGTRWEYTFSCPGDIGSFGIPSVSTTAVSSVEKNTASSGGIVTADNGSPVTLRGVVWSTSSSPTIALSTKTVNGEGNGTFQSALAGLVPNTKYYVRAYATNGAGTGYGNEVTFTTTAENTVNLSLEGKWMTTAGNGVNITGSSGVFYVFSSAWKEVEAKGLAKIGDQKFKNITKSTTYKWTFLEYGIRTENGVPVEGLWSYDGTITMSSDGKSITADSNTIMQGSSKNSVTIYYRQ